MDTTTTNQNAGNSCDEVEMTNGSIAGSETSSDGENSVATAVDAAMNSEADGNISLKD